MFTFYDNLYGFNEKVWNLCYNESLKHWVSFYSWVPSFSENIYNQYFSFDRNCSKWIAKIDASLGKGSIAVNNAIISKYDNNTKPKIEIFITDSIKESNKYFNMNCEFTLENDIYGNNEKFELVHENGIWVLIPKCDYEDLCTEDYYRIKGDKEVTPDDEEYELNLPIAYDENNRRKWLTGYHKIPVILLNISAKVSISLKDTKNNWKE